MIWLWFVQEGPERISKGHFAHELMDSWMPMDAMVNPRGSTKKIQVLVIFHYCPLVNKQFTSLLWKITNMFFYGDSSTISTGPYVQQQTVNVYQAGYSQKLRI
jgi:hypothetical protein